MYDICLKGKVVSSEYTQSGYIVVSSATQLGVFIVTPRLCLRCVYVSLSRAEVYT